MFAHRYKNVSIIISTMLNTNAPDFSLPDQNGTLTSLKDAKSKWLVLYFYPKDDTPGCTIEAIDFTKLASAFTKAGAIVWGVSPDSGKSHCGFIEKHGLGITLLSDVEKEVLALYGAWGKKKFMGREYMGVVRSTFLIDPVGKIAQVWRDVAVKGHAEEVLEAVRALKT